VAEDESISERFVDQMRFSDAPPSIDADEFGPIAAISGFEFFDFRDSPNLL
jgi:hypothetical protein